MNKLGIFTFNANQYFHSVLEKTIVVEHFSTCCVSKYSLNKLLNRIKAERRQQLAQAQLRLATHLIMFGKLWVVIFGDLQISFIGGFRFALLAVAFAVFTSTQAQVPVVPAVAAAYAWSPYYYPWAYPAVVAWGSDKVPFGCGNERIPFGISL